MALEHTQVAVVPSTPEALALRLLQRYLAHLRYGELTVSIEDGRNHTWTGSDPGPSAALHVHEPFALLRRLFGRGDLGFAESFLEGEWNSPDLSALLHLAGANEDVLPAGGTGIALFQIADRLGHRLRANTRDGSRRNIACHYDLGNDFYRLWLDPGMTYSGALFEGVDEELETAQRRKYARLIDLTGAQPGDHMLEIGCGWGGFAEEAARRGMRVTGITLSGEQLRYARARIRAAGLQDRVELRLQDYRDVRGQFDHVVSIEMFEAVGEEYWPGYFAQLRALLRPGGRAALQSITIHPRLFDRYRRRADFIQRYIFPGGMLPPVAKFQQLARDAGLVPRGHSLHGRDYAETLRRWHVQFNQRKDELSEMNFDQRFIRMWRYYLAYCEAGFLTGHIDLMLTALERPA